MEKENCHADVLLFSGGVESEAAGGGASSASGTGAAVRTGAGD
jgi:hypothetical protein